MLMERRFILAVNLIRHNKTITTTNKKGGMAV